MTTPEILLISSVNSMLEAGSGLDNLVLLLSRQFYAAAARPMGPGNGARHRLKDMFESAAESSFHVEPFITLNKSSKPGGGNSYACAKMK